MGWRYISSLHSSDESEEGETAFSVAILLYRFLLCLVSQNVFRIESALPELFVFTYFRLIRSLDDPTLQFLVSQ